MGIQIKKQEQLNQLGELDIQETLVLAGIVRMREVVALKSIVEKLGLGWSNTYEKMKRDKYWNQLFLECNAISKDGKTRKMMCLSVYDLQEWLFHYPFPESIDRQRLEAFRYRLVMEIQNALLSMLKVSMIELERLMAIEKLFLKSKSIFDEYIIEEEKAKELLTQGKEHAKRAAELKQQYFEVSRSPQLELFD